MAVESSAVISASCSDQTIGTAQSSASVTAGWKTRTTGSIPNGPPHTHA
jgi:hypothetical protein